MKVPILTTARLTLRAPAESDLAAMTAFGASPRSVFVGGPYTNRDAWRMLLAGIGHWALRGYGYWSVDRTADGAFVGRVGVIFRADTPEAELDWYLFDGFEGHGYAYEAVVAARDYAAQHFGLGPLISYIDAENTRSAAMAVRLGARHERVMYEDGKPYDAYRHPEIVTSGAAATSGPATAKPRPAPHPRGLP